MDAGSHTWKALQILPAGEGSVGGHWGQQLTGGLDRSRRTPRVELLEDKGQMAGLWAFLPATLWRK